MLRSEAGAAQLLRLLAINAWVARWSGPASCSASLLELPPAAELSKDAEPDHASRVVPRVHPLLVATVDPQTLARTDTTCCRKNAREETKKVQAVVI